MSDGLTPDEVEEDHAKSRVVAGLVRAHYEALIGTGFKEEEAWELTVGFHWALLTDTEVCE